MDLVRGYGDEVGPLGNLDTTESLDGIAEHHRAGLMRKLNVHDLVGLVKFAIERNLTTTSATR